MNENMNLDDLMGGKRPRSTTTIDLTGSQATVNGEKIEPIKNPTIKAVPVVSGPVDTNNLRPVDIDRILPKREPAPNPIETKLMDDLDAAVDREIENITKLHEDIAAKHKGQNVIFALYLNFVSTIKTYQPIKLAGMFFESA